MSWRIVQGDCVERMRELDECSVDAVVCDPPYGLEFMGRSWDRLTRDWESSISTTGYTDAERLPRPNFGSTRNPMCRTCRKHQRGSHRCECEQPDFDQTPADANRRMQDWHQRWAAEALRVLKPGGHLLAFGGTRTYHRLACAIEDAGFEIRDCIAWLYGSGFPKSLDVSKAIDKRRDWSLVERLAGEIRRARAEAGLSLAEIGEAMQAATDGQYGKWYHRGGHMFFETGRALPSRPEWNLLRDVLPISEEFREVYEEAEREVTGQRDANLLAVAPGQGEDRSATTLDVTAPATPEAEQWDGWGTALKPAHEPVVVARKPLAGTVAGNVLEHGTGALNVDGCRIGTEDLSHEYDRSDFAGMGYGGAAETHEVVNPGKTGRWPANVALDPEAARMLDEQSGELTSGSRQEGVRKGLGYHGAQGDGGPAIDGDSGGASRFFYCAKASRAERNAGLEGFEDAPRADVMSMNAHDHEGGIDGRGVPYKIAAVKNNHPTVKPIDLMRWLVRLVTPPGGLVLDPFCGSGTTGCAAVLEGFDFVGLEREPEYVQIAEARIGWWDRHRADGKAAEVLAAGEVREAVELTGQRSLFDEEAA